MAKSKYAEQLKGGIPLLKALHDGEIGRLERAGQADKGPILEAWEDLAGSERLVKENHQGRYLFELIQNANDAIVDAGAGINQLARADHRVRIELTERSLLVANFGQPFGEDNVRALRRLHKTTKKMGALQEENGQLSISKRIGHKGIGFKSVLEITSRPEVYSDIYAFGFDANQFYEDVSKLVKDALNWTLPTFRVPYPRDINRLPENERDRIEQLLDDGFVTVVRLPFDEPGLIEAITDRLEQDVHPELLLFMTALSRLEVQFADGREVAYERHVGTLGDTDLQMVRLCRHDASGEHIDSRWLTLQETRQIRDPSLLIGLGEAWKDVEALGFALAFPLRLRDRESEPLSATQSSAGECRSSEPFHVYYPTHECSGLSFKIHADFYVGDNRKSIPPDKRINRWLISEICDFLSGEGLECLKKQWPYDAQLVYRLLPVDRPAGPFARAFMETYLSMLSVTPFVPIPGQNYKAPEDIKLPPREVDQQRFQDLFSSARLRAGENWTYPVSEVVEREIEREVYREQHSDALQLLLRSELGAEFVSIDLVVGALQREGMPPVEEADEPIALLADWYAELPGPQRRTFLEQLSMLPIYPTVSGWKYPDRELVFQANIRSEVDEDTVPDGFDFSVIRRSVYPLERGATASNQYGLFAALGAREYSRRSLILEAILPTLADEQRFLQLLSNYPNAVYQAYHLLRDYFEEGGTTRDFKQRLAQVPVPIAADGGWSAAGDCYFGIAWPSQSGELLQRIYEGFLDCSFLGNIPELEIRDAEDQERWAEFFRWLGVASYPRVLVAERRIGRGEAAPLPNLIYWSEYMEGRDSDFWCPNPASYHGYSRGLLSVRSMHHFEELVQEGDLQKLSDLFVLLSRYWESDYKSLSRTTIACDRTTCVRGPVDDYFLFELQNAQWLPAQVGDTRTAPLSPRQIWYLGETDPADARELVPALAEELRPYASRDFVTALGFVSSSTAGVEDYVELLKLLPERYPVEPTGLSEIESRRWQRSLAAVFNWICEHIQTGLVGRGDDVPTLPQELQVLAYRGDELVYAPLNSPDLVYANDDFLEQRWKERCVYIRINDDWRTLLAWLKIPDLSEAVHSQCHPLGELEQDSGQLREGFIAALPYYLSLIKRQQPANYDRIVPRLLRLDLHVVKELRVTEKLISLPDQEPVVTKVDVYLQKREDENPGAGRRLVVAGDLYLAKDAADNLDLLGDYIADYIEVARLGDAFVVLINRSSDRDRWRFLESKGVTKDIYDDVLLDIQARTEREGQSESTHPAIAKAMAAIAIRWQTATVEPTDPSRQVGDRELSEQKKTEVQVDEKTSIVSLPEYPALDLRNLPGIQVATLDGDDGGNGDNRGGGGGNGGPGPGRVPRQEVTEALGRRGEQWVYENERLRLENDYGFVPDELEELEELVWVSDRKPTSNYDIRSVWVTETDEQRPLYIEVKASTGDSRHISMSRQEFLLAMGLGADYWLCWVANVDEAQPAMPICYKNVSELVAKGKLVIDVDTLALTLPRSVISQDNQLSSEVGSTAQPVRA